MQTLLKEYVLLEHVLVLFWTVLFSLMIASFLNGILLGDFFVTKQL